MTSGNEAQESSSSAGWPWPIKESQRLEETIRVLLLTAPGERVMRPDYGCRVHTMPFRPPGPERGALVKYYVRQCLGQHLPQLESSKVKISNQKEESTTAHIQGRNGADGQSLSVLVTFHHEPGDD